MRCLQSPCGRQYIRGGFTISKHEVVENKLEEDAERLSPIAIEILP